MTVAVVSGSGGLIGSEACERFGRSGRHIVGIDNDMRRAFFGPEASTRWNVDRLKRKLGEYYSHHDFDIRDRPQVLGLFRRYSKEIEFIVHAAAQPSHDWAATDPFTDFDTNAVGTLNLLEATRKHAPNACFVFLSTNKVYGDRPNSLPFVELDTRYEIEGSHEYAHGISEDMPIDSCLHSLFGASKIAADVLVQEYGRYFGMATVCFRGGTLTGPLHSATRLHGFLAYLMRCTMSHTHYRIFGYKGKQVRDVIHSSDLIRAIEEFVKDPRAGEIYNIGGGRFSNCSVLEGIRLSQEVAGRELSWSYEESPRRGDHVWWIGSNHKFQAHYPNWHQEYDVDRILKEIFEFNSERWTPRARASSA
jgi:CDP-paratose 2-epimerase